MNLYFFVILTACLICVDISDGLSFHLLSFPVTTAFFLSLITGFFVNRRIRIPLQLLFGETFIFVCFIDCYCQTYFDTPITPQIFTNILLSDNREKSEFLLQFINWTIFCRWRIVILLFLALSMPIWLIRKWEFSLWTGKWKTISFIVLTICIVHSLPASWRYAKLFFQRHQLEDIEGLMFRHYHKGAPTPLHRLFFSIYASNQSANVFNAIKYSTFVADIDSCSYLSPHIVLIIGESYNKHHSSLYGYHLETTPLQQKRLGNEELFLFSDAVTPWNITSNVFVSVFSLWENNCKGSIGDYPLFPILFRQAGYMVRFFSNQYLLKGFRKGATNQVGHFFLADAEMSDSLFSYRNRRSSQFDMGLVGQVADYKDKQSEQLYTLDIIHLVGQHFDYSMRYPHSQATFSLNDYAKRPLTNEAKEIVMHYDNATRYNDRVLDCLLSLYSKEETIVVFLADHGEEVYDKQPVHGRLFSDPTKDIATQEYEVPMWIWCSESYQANHQNIVNAIKASQDKPFITESLPQLLLALAGICCQWSDDSQNILSPQYKCNKRIISGSVDYDILTE